MKIEADAAKLAGLQIDLLQKVRQGHITLHHLEWFTRLSKDMREALMSGDKSITKIVAQTESTEMFVLLVDLGIITVPDGYVHENRLTTFDKQNRKKFYYYNNNISDKNFPNPTRVLKPSDKLRVCAFKQVIGGTTTSEERMAFLATQKAIHTGAQGLSLVFDQKRDQLPKGKYYASFDEKDRLWPDDGGRHRVPLIDCSNNTFTFDLGNFDNFWGGINAFILFRDVE